MKRLAVPLTIALVLLAALGARALEAATGPEQAPSPRARRALEESVAVPRGALANGAAPHLTGLRLGAFPILMYNSDIGFGMGLGVAIFDYGPGLLPYRHALLLSGFMTTRFVQTHAIDWYAPKIGGSAFSLRVKLKFQRQIDAAYFGIGNRARYERSREIPSHEDFITRNFYRFTHSTPSLAAQVRHGLSGAWSAWGGYSFRYAIVEPYKDSLLARERPRGTGGGAVSMLHAGVVWDTRDHPTSTTRGHWLEVSGRLSPSFLGSGGTFGGVTVADHIFWSPFERLVLANRVLLDLLVGDVPFFELNQFGDTAMTDGLGGAWSMRGYSANRFIGKVKVVVNPEARFRFLSWHWWRQRFDLSAVAFFDVGRVWARYADDGPLGRIHWSGGGGLRLIWDRNFLFRVEVGASMESTRVFVEIAAPY